MLRGVVYLLLGWALIALVAALANQLELTVMLPSTSAVLVAHVAFSRNAPVVFGLAVAIALGYLEDLHQGVPIGVLTLAHALAYLGLRWIAARVALGGWIMRAIVSVASVVLIDLATWAILMVLSEALGVRREAVTMALLDIRWHALATLLVAPPVWAVTDRLFAALRLDDRSPQHSYWKGR